LIIASRHALEECHGVDRVGALRRSDEYGEMGARREMTVLFCARECRERSWRGCCVKECGDALRTHCIESRLGRLDVLGRRRLRNRRFDGLHGGILEDAGGISRGVTPHLAAQWIGCLRGDVRERQRAAIDERRMSERRRHQDGSLGMQRIEHQSAGDSPRRQHRLLKPVADQQPASGLLVLALIKTTLDFGLHLRDRQTLVVQIAVEQYGAAVERMHMPVNEPGHQHAAVKIGDVRILADKRLYARVPTHVDDRTLTHGECLLHTILGIDGVHVAVLIDGIRRQRLRRRCAHGEQSE